MTKVNGSLGFTLRKEDHSALGHYVRALVREPALSDGRIQPGDRIVAVSTYIITTISINIIKTSSEFDTDTQIKMSLLSKFKFLTGK